MMQQADPHSEHLPVMAEEALAWLDLGAGEVLLDGTFGRGGHSRLALERSACRVLALDRDPEAIAAGQALSAEFGERLTLRHGRFGDMERHAAAAGLDSVDAVLLDLGVSSPQLDEAARGFSFAKDGPLDMRMEAETAAGDRPSPSARDLVNDLDEAALAKIFFELGEERHGRRVARAIVAARRLKPIERSGELASIVRRGVGPKGAGKIDPATRSFQGLRLAVNDELGELSRGLAAAERLLAPKGRLVVISFHSLEDRLVKRFLRRRAGRTPGRSRHLPAAPAAAEEASFVLPFGNPLAPSPEELARNPRARSARLRAAHRTIAAPLAEETVA